MCVWGGAWVTQSVEQLTLGFSSGRDVRVTGSSPTSSRRSAQCLFETLSPSAPPCHTPSLSQNKSIFKK